MEFKPLIHTDKIGKKESKCSCVWPAVFVALLGLASLGCVYAAIFKFGAVG